MCIGKMAGIASAIELYKVREVSLSRAAEIAGMNIEDFKHVLSDRGVKRTIKPDPDIDKLSLSVEKSSLRKFRL